MVSSWLLEMLALQFIFVAVLISFPCDEYDVRYLYDLIRYPDLREMQILHGEFCLCIKQCVVHCCAWFMQHGF